MNIAQLLNRKDEIEYEIFQLSQDMERVHSLVMELEAIVKQIVLIEEYE
jgi:hypothetical protein